MKSLDNGIISIAVKEHGAELSSLRHAGREYLWQADPEFWGRTSPVLFPIVGSVWNKELRSHGQVFTMGQHGFARDMDFEFAGATDNELWFKLASSPATLERFPYDFILEIGYRLQGSSVQVIWKVTNPDSACEDLHFQIGAHPAFHWPLLSNEAIAGGTAAMKAELAGSTERGYFRFTAARTVLRKSVIREGGCFDEALQSDVELEDGAYIALDTASFDRDALVFEHGQTTAVSLCDQDRKPYLTVHYPDAPIIGLWSCPGKNAPFVCIEPWYGRADECGYDGPYDRKPWINTLPPGESFVGGYTIEVE